MQLSQVPPLIIRSGFKLGELFDCCVRVNELMSNYPTYFHLYCESVKFNIVLFSKHYTYSVLIYIYSVLVSCRYLSVYTCLYIKIQVRHSSPDVPLSYI